MKSAHNMGGLFLGDNLFFPKMASPGFSRGKICIKGRCPGESFILFSHLGQKSKAAISVVLLFLFNSKNDTNTAKSDTNTEKMLKFEQGINDNKNN
ncbi:hypothetical protein Ga0451573_000730 [Peptococcaceae bacterium DYL19]|nr:hypothetical protein [Phosphitispora fastidiosa]